MKIHPIFICVFLTALQDRHTGLIAAENLDHTGSEGGNVTVKCSFSFSGRKRIFCKNDCEGKDILVETEEDRAQRDRYSIEYKEGNFPTTPTLLYVSITNLTKSDSGRYRCALERDWALDAYKEFYIRVKDAPTSSQPNWTLPPSSTSAPSASTPRTTQSLSSSSGTSTSSSASPETTEQPQQQQQTPAARPGVLLYVGVILLVMVVVLLLAGLILCKKRAGKRREARVETEYANVTEADREYEEIREDRRNRSPPVEISTIYICAKHAETNRDETTDDYSFVTAASAQNKTEDESSKLTYSVVDLFDGPAASLNSAPRGDADNVTYSVPRVTTSSDGSHAEDASAPLYSAVTLCQQ